MRREWHQTSSETNRGTGQARLRSTLKAPVLRVLRGWGVGEGKAITRARISSDFWRRRF